jgi:hypothetical protein
LLEEEALKDGSFLKLPEIPELRMMPEDGNTTSTSFGPRLYVREDGTVDWEGALQDRAALRKFGGAVWARINGQTPDNLEEDEIDLDQEAKKKSADGGAEKKAAVTANIEDTVAIQEARKELNRLQAQLREMEKVHIALLASGKFWLKGILFRPFQGLGYSHMYCYSSDKGRTTGRKCKACIT